MAKHKHKFVPAYKTHLCESGIPHIEGIEYSYCDKCGHKGTINDLTFPILYWQSLEHYEKETAEYEKSQEKLKKDLVIS